MCRVRAIYQNKLACCVTGLSGGGLFKHCLRIIQAALETDLSGAKLASIESARMRSCFPLLRFYFVFEVVFMEVQFAAI